MEESARILVRRFELQERAAVQRGSPLYRFLLRQCAADLTRGGPTWRLLRERAGEPAGAALPLRLLAAVHRLVLDGRAPVLGACYPSVGGQSGFARVWPAFRAVLEERAEPIKELLDRPLQTNEVGRCSGLLLGFAQITAATALPLAVLEIGASAGLNLNWRHYHYRSSRVEFGPAESPVQLQLPSAVDRLAAPQQQRPGRGCDRHPLDPGDEQDRLWLRSCVWADQTDRLALLDAALLIARRHPPAVARADAVDWLGHVLAAPRPGAATVVVQTIVQQYLGRQERTDLRALLGAAGRRATPDAPLAWLRMEPPERGAPVREDVRGLCEVRLALWPGGHDRLVAHAGYHGRPLLPVMPGARTM